MTRLLPAAALALLAACQSSPKSGEMAAVRTDPVCQAHRSAFPQRAAIGLQDECRRQLGEDWCRQCLVQ